MPRRLPDFAYGRTRYTRSADGRVTITRMPQSEWRVVVKDRYPAYVDWQTFERIQTMLRDNYAEYLRRETRGTPRDGAALLQGIAWCGECGHKLVVQYCNGNRYACTYLQHTQGAPMCQHLPADPIDARVVDAFFEAVAPAELDAWEQARAAQHEAAERSIAPRRSRLSGCATRRCWPGVSSTGSIPTIAWSPPSWNAAGRWPCATCARPRRRWHNAAPTAPRYPA